MFFKSVALVPSNILHLKTSLKFRIVEIQNSKIPKVLRFTKGHLQYLHVIFVSKLIILDEQNISSIPYNICHIPC